LALIDAAVRGAVNAARALFAADGADYSLMRPLHGDAPKVDHHATYEMLRALYFNDWAGQEAGSDHLILGLRNPVAAVVNFYAATMWPGTLPDALPVAPGSGVASPDELVAAIHELWGWSNWNSQKQVYARNAAMLGDSLIKVATRSDAAGAVRRVYFDLIDPDFLTDFDTDERDYLTYVRLDVPRERRAGDTVEPYTHTEVWDKVAGLYRVWEHNRGATADLRDLGTPDREATMASFGIDFIPFVFSKFRDIGQKRGVAAVTTALVKAHEANRMATEGHRRLYQYGTPDKQLVGAGMRDGDGLPMPAPKLRLDDAGIVQLNGKSFWVVPGGWRIEDILSNINFSAHIEALDRHLAHLQQTDLPELAYYQIADARELSGKAIRFMLTAAISNAEEARGTAEAALIRANQMGLTLGSRHKLPGFQSLGAFEAGQLDHTFEKRSVIPLSEEEEAQIDKMKAETQALKRGRGYSRRFLMQQDGLSEDEITEALAADDADAMALAGDQLASNADAEAERLLAAALNRGDGA
jgi:hypothetical protein